MRASFYRTKEPNPDGGDPVDVFSAEVPDGVITVRLWPLADGYVVLQGLNGDMGGAQHHATLQVAMEDMNRRVAAQIVEWTRPSRTFHSSEVCNILGVSRQSLSLIRRRLKVGTPQGRGFVFRRSELLRMLRRKLAAEPTTRVPKSTVERAYRNIYLRSKLTERQKNVLRLRYGLDGGKPLTFAETALRLGIKRQAVNVHERTALQTLLRSG